MERIRFANQLRGLAALAVVCSHLLGVFWAMPDVVANTTFSPPLAGPVPGAFALVSQPWLNFGPLGVALFFLISGLVIPISLDKHSRTSFVLARLLRVYPTYVAALLLEVVVLLVAAHAWGRPFGYSAAAIVSNALLIYDLIGRPSIDLVNWTLSVELKFYLLVVLLAPFIRRGNAMALFAAAAAIFGANALIAAGVVGHIDAPPSSPSYTFSSHSLCLIYMLIGTLFNFHLRGRIGTPALLASIAVLSGLFAATWQVSVWRDQYPFVTVNYAYAVVVFGALYAGRRWVPRNRVLDALAAISFPLYLIHSLLGYSMLKALMIGVGLGYYPALLLTLLVVLGTATAIHYVVERPTIRAGRRLAPSAGRASPAPDAAGPLVISAPGSIARRGSNMG